MIFFYLRKLDMINFHSYFYPLKFEILCKLNSEKIV